MEVTERENKFLSELGFTPGKWEWYDNKRSGLTILSGGKPESTFPILKPMLIEDSPGKENRSLIEQSPAMFLTLFNMLQRDYFFIEDEDDGEMFDENCKALLSAQRKCKTFEELLKVWEDTE